MHRGKKELCHRLRWWRSTHNLPMCVQDNFPQKLIQPTWLCCSFFFISKTINSLFFLVFAMAEHENRQKFVTSYEGQLGRNLCMVVCLQKQTEMQKFCCSFITRFCFVFLTTHSVVGGYGSLTIASFFQLNQRTKLSGFWPI